MSLFDKILIANRGEIACRVIRSCRALGIRTVAVYSDADAGALHVAMADEAVRLGPAEAARSYLDPEAVLAAAVRTGANAIHPGYGFLSENAEFAERVEAAGIVFIGPKAASMRAMGSKAGAKALMQSHGVPVVPGYNGEAQDPAHLKAQADAVGYPLMIKAAHGGGGKGMRIVRAPADFDAALASCRREALGAFGKDRVLLERYVESPRHIEFQIFADGHGHTVHLGERECSAQRRFQKVLEESPSPFLDPARRARMAAAAIQAAKAVDYRNAGTVEFIVAPDGEFFFMEINSRLQVEHPVTEMVTGLDLVRWQIEIAAGLPLPLAQDDIRHRGHAIEVRLYAEDPQRNFMPGSGRIRGLRLPSGAGVRIDTGFRQGDTIGVHYDPMLAKLIVHADDRPLALQALQDALAQCHIAGLPSNIAFLERLVAHPSVQRAEIDTGYLDRHLDDVLADDGEPPDSHRLAAAYFSLKRAEAAQPEGVADPWQARDFWRTEGHGRFRVRLRHDDAYRTHLCHLAGGEWHVACEGRMLRADIRDGDMQRLSLAIDGRHIELHAFHDGEALTVHDGRRRTHWWRQLPGADAAESAAGSDGFTRAPMPGKLVLLKVAPGQRVAEGDEVAVMEAMKMELSIKAVAAGTVQALLAEPGRILDADAPILQWEPRDG